ncbi:MAG: 50S ribosomal protein L28 [Eubacteriales bacterium]
MAKYCEICKKGIMSGNKVSHSNRKSKRKWAPNIRHVTMTVDGSPKKMYVCTRCIRTQAKNS